MPHAKGINVTVSNAGIGVDPDTGMLARFDSVVDSSTRVLVLQRGSNDSRDKIEKIKHGDAVVSRDKIAPAETKANIDQIRAKAAARHIKVIDAQRFIAGGYPIPQGWAMQSDIRTPRATVSWRRPCFRWLSLRSEIEGDAGPVGMRRQPQRR